LLEPSLAFRAFTAGINETTDSGQIARFEFGHMIARLNYAPDDFMPGHHRIDRTAPLITDLMDIGMADAAVQNLDLDVMRTNFAPLKTERAQWIGWAVSGISLCVVHSCSIAPNL
jgi:hypothetical protein